MQKHVTANQAKPQMGLYLLSDREVWSFIGKLKGLGRELVPGRSGPPNELCGHYVLVFPAGTDFGDSEEATLARCGILEEEEDDERMQDGLAKFDEGSDQASPSGGDEGNMDRSDKLLQTGEQKNA